MPKFTRTGASLLATALATMPASAQTDWESALTAYYLLRATSQNCATIKITPAEDKLLREVILNAETKSGMALAARTELANDLADTVKDSPAICAQTAPTFHERMKNVAEAPR